MKLHQKLFLLLVFLLPIQISRHFWPQWSYILGLRVDYLSPTVYLTDILVIVILLLWGIEKLKFNILKLLIFPVSIFAFLLVNSFLAQNQGAALYKFIKIIEFTLFGFYIARNKIFLSIIHYPLSIAVVYSSLIALAQFLKQSSLGGIFWWLGERTFNAGTPGIAKTVWSGQLIMRPYGTFPHPNVLAGFVLVSLILILSLQPQNTSDGGPKGLLRGGGIKEALRWLATAFGIITILISFSRSAWLVGLGMLLFLLFKTPWMVVKQRFRLLRGGGILFANFADEAFLQRIELNRISFQLIKEQPLIGIGLNNFIVHLPEFWQRVGQIYWLQPVHNIYLLVAAETGAIGLAIFFWFLFLTFKRFHNSILLYCYIAILLLGFFDHYWLTLQQTQLLLTIILGLAWAKK